MAAAPTAQAGSVRFEDDGLAVPQPKGEAKQPFVIGVGGGTASGKSTVCDMIIQQLHDHRVVLVNQAYHSISFTHLASSTLVSMQINHFSNLRIVHVGAILWVDL
jgi:pantothenate kinase